MISRYGRRIEPLEVATNNVCGRGCVKCLLASLPVVENRGAPATVKQFACDGDPMSLFQMS
jgi:hypothetical protein